MNIKKDQHAQIEAAKERLKGFIRPASTVNFNDPERLARQRERRQTAPRLVSWEQLGRGTIELW